RMAGRRRQGEGDAAGGETADARPRPQGEGAERRRPEGAGGRGEGGFGRRAGGGPDMQEMLERMPAVTVSELQPGEMVIVSSTLGADPARVTAIALVAGVEALLQGPAQQQRGPGGRGTDLGMPSGALDIGIGLP
ncbi:MAG: hypothetical protein ACRD68_06345, partial [Pyrinomonadaceae bacterium]